MKILISFFYASLSLLVLSKAAEPRAYVCGRLAQEPVLDGKIDEQAWQTAPLAAGFYKFPCSGSFAVEKPTFFKAGWTKDSLYLAVMCGEPNPDKLKALPEDGEGLWNGDNIEMFFLPDGVKKYIQLAANSAGARWNIVEGESYQKPWNWQVKTSAGEDCWMLEAKIPFAILQKTPADGSKWLFNIARNVMAGPESERYTCRPPLTKGFSETGKFDSLLFKDVSLSSQEVRETENKLNAEYQAWLQKKSAEIVQTIKSNNEFNLILKNPNLETEADQLTKAMAVVEQVSKKKGMNCPEFALAVQACLNQVHKLEARVKFLGVSLGSISVEAGPTKQVQFEIKTRNAKATLLVNGRTLDPGVKSAEIREGLTVIGIRAEAQGPNPGVQIRLAGCPETDGRWRAANSKEKYWQISSFDDTKWPQAAADSNGFMWCADAAKPEVFFRQIILWNQRHDGPNRCIQPLVREWGFSEGSMETLFMTLYSPLPFPLDDYEIIFDVPECFRMLDVMNSSDRLLCRRPQKVVREKVRQEGMVYTRYRFYHSADHVPVDRTDAMQIPLCLDKFTVKPPGEKSGLTLWWDMLRRVLRTDSACQADTRLGNKTCRFYCRRQAHGNFTELQQSLPVRILPPINGRMPKKVMISQYRTGVLPWGWGLVSEEQVKLLIQQAARAGFNYWFVIWSPTFVGNKDGEYVKLAYNLALQNGFHIALWTTIQNWPSNGAKSDVGADFYKWLEAVPEARARYFQDGESWTKKGMYCPSYVTTAGAEKFREFVKTGYEQMLAGAPAAEIIWIDFEESPWAGGNPHRGLVAEGKGSYCFCERCKKAFRSFARVPASTDLTDEIIFKDYLKPWHDFRNSLDGRIHGQIRQVCHELGRPYMLYSQTVQYKLWEACSNRIDIAFPGLPGNPVADGHCQKWLDEHMMFFREKLGMKRVLGQRFSFFENTKKDGWKDWRALSYDKYVDAKSWKPQIIRMVASLHRGVDLSCVLECCAGMQYYIGEATRIISEYEPLFWDGERADDLAQSGQIKYPNLLVLKRGTERLVLLFNEKKEPLTVDLNNKELQPDQTAVLYESSLEFKNPEQMRVIMPPEDVVIVHIFPRK